MLGYYLHIHEIRRQSTIASQEMIKSNNKCEVCREILHRNEIKRRRNLKKKNKNVKNNKKRNYIIYIVSLFQKWHN